MKVTAIGGGTGLSATARALRAIEGLDIAIIVATTDNGGSTGLIRRWSGCIAWGDLRHVINALSEMSLASLEALLFDYRFEDNEGALSGHSLGNIILHALENLAPRPQAALDLVTHWLRVNARIIPMSETVTELTAASREGLIEGEVEIDRMEQLPERLQLSPQVSATPEAIEAVKDADLVVLGPGSVMTSVVPSLLLPDLVDALRTTPAKKVWVHNLGGEGGPMGGLNPTETHRWLSKILGFDYCDLILADDAIEFDEDLGPVHRADLRDTRSPDRHSSEKLSSAYRTLLAST